MKILSTLSGTQALELDVSQLGILVEWKHGTHVRIPSTQVCEHRGAFDSPGVNLCLLELLLRCSVVQTKPDEHLGLLLVQDPCVQLVAALATAQHTALS